MRLPANRATWQRVAAILDQTLELPPAKRAAVLDKVCDGSPELRAEVEELLEADAEAGSFLENPLGEVATTLLADAPLPAGTAPSPAEPAPAQPDAGSAADGKLGPYRVLREIGAGGMGVVYEGWDRRLDRRVALKLLPPEWSRDRRAKERFVREARAAATLDHPNICTVHDVGESDDGQLYIVMAYYQGETLEHRIARGPLPPAEARDLAVQVARGLERAHAAGVVHRDVKPSNIMVTEARPDHDRMPPDRTPPDRMPPDRAKILDFGIARVAGDAGLTRAGGSPGTPAYMSPEQASGEAVDERTDVWSLGVMLYEMLAGRRPFRARLPAAVIHQILNRQPEPLEEICPETPAALARVVARAMARDPAERYQSVSELLADLESEAAPPATAAGPSGRRRFTLAATLLAVLAALGGWWVACDAEPRARASMAVLRFQNLSGEADLDWLRLGLADLLITDLSQSPEIEVLDLQRLDRILEDSGASGTETASADQLEELSGHAEAVLQGSFVRSGERLRINFNLRHSAGGRILLTDWVEDPQERLFAMVDKVSRLTRRSLEIPPRVELADTVAEVTTSSYEAWRLFSEGRQLAGQSRWDEARPLFEEAIANDPEFALALVDLSNLHVNLGHDRVAREYARRASEQAERLPLQQRYFVEGEFHSGTWSGYARAIKAYRQGLDLFPGDLGMRSNLAAHLAYLERYEEAIREYQAAIDHGDDYAGTYFGAATALGALDDFETGGGLLIELARRSPGDWFAQLVLGWNLTDRGRLDEAAVALRRAEDLRPGDFNVRQGWWRWRILREDWEGAAGDVREMASSSDPHDRWLALVCDAWTGLFSGRSRPAAARLAESARAYSQPEGFTALSHCWTARLLLLTGRPDEALAAAQQAQQEAPGDWPELEGMFLAALARQALGQPEAADRLAEGLRGRAAKMPNTVEKRQLHHLEGRLALARGDTGRALRELTAAEALLSPRGFWFHRHVLPDHLPLWYTLGEAERAAGRPEKAAEWFRKVTSSGTEHLEYPVLFGRSFYQLGEVYEALGLPHRAAEAYGRFHGYWRDGDLDREQVEVAAAKSARVQP